MSHYVPEQKPRKWYLHDRFIQYLGLIGPKA